MSNFTKCILHVKKHTSNLIYFIKRVFEFKAWLISGNKVTWFENIKSNQILHVTRRLTGTLFAIFLWTGTTFDFHSNGKFPLSKYNLKIISRDLHIDGPHVLNIQMIVLSWSCDFSESKIWITCRMSLLEKIVLDKNISILSKSSDGRLLLLFITVHCMTKMSYIIEPSLKNQLKASFDWTNVEQSELFLI